MPPKRRSEREQELQALLTTTGYVQLQELAARCAARPGRPNGLGESLVNYILASEREAGLIGD